MRFPAAWPGVELRYTATGDTVREALVVSRRSRVRDFAIVLLVALLAAAAIWGPSGGDDLDSGALMPFG